MPSRPGSLAALQVIAPRAAIGYLLLRPLLAVLEAFLTDAGGTSALGSLTNPFGIALLAGALGFTDIVRRGERLFWANLGYPALAVPAVIAAVATLGELLLALLL